jgi:hypothetical protein
MPIAGSLGCTGSHPLISVTLLGISHPEERERTITDNNMYLFCLQHGNYQDYYVKGTDIKPACSVLECARKHVKWLHKLTAKELASENVLSSAET